MSLYRNNLRFTRFFASFTIGNIGDWFDIFALQIIFVHEWHASPIMLSLLILCYFLPSILLGPIAGVWCDKLSKRNLMLFTDSIAGLFTIGLFLSDNIHKILFLVFMRAAIVSFNTPAQNAYIKYVVADEALLKASSYTTITLQMCKVIGPMLGALVLIYASPRSCIAINAFSFILSAIILATLPKDLPPKDRNNQERSQHWIHDIATGLQFIKQHPLLRIVVSLIMAWFFCSLIRQTQLSLFLKHLLPNKQGALGLFMGLDGLGAVSSGMLLSRQTKIIHYRGYFSSGFLLLSVGIFGTSIYHAGWPDPILYTFALIIGLGTGILLVTFNYLLKNETPKHQMGRVSGTSLALQNAALATGTLSSGFFTLQFGIREVYFGLSIAMLLLALCSFIFMRTNVRV